MTITVEALARFKGTNVCMACKAKGGYLHIAHFAGIDVVRTKHRETRRDPETVNYAWQSQDFDDVGELIHAMNNQGFELPKEEENDERRRDTQTGDT